MAISTWDRTILSSLTPDPRIPALLGNLVVFQDGVPLASLQGGEPQLYADSDEGSRSAVLELLRARRGVLTPQAQASRP